LQNEAVPEEHMHKRGGWLLLLVLLLLAPVLTAAQRPASDPARPAPLQSGEQPAVHPAQQPASDPARPTPLQSGQQPAVQSGQQPAVQPGQQPAAQPSQQPAVDPTQVAAFDPEQATAAYLARQTPEQKAKSDAYFEGGYWLQLWGFLYGLGVAWALLASGLSQRLRDAAARVTSRRPLQTWLYAVGYLLLATLLSFPLTVYQSFFREHQYGLATQGFGGWLRDQAVGLAVSLVFVPLLLLALYAALRRAPRTWWLWGAGLALAFLVFGLLIAPVYIDPLFNTYEPLPAGETREEVLSLARSSGIEAGDVYRFDASRQTTRVSANVSGFMGTMAIRLNDNLLNRCTLPEVRAVMGHEIGHYALNHVYEGLVFFGVVLVGGFGFLRATYGRAQRRFGARWGVTGIEDVAGLPLLVALFSVYIFLLTPVVNTHIRTDEIEADLYGLQTAHEPDGFAEVSLKLGEYRKLAPGPLEEFLFYDHPSGRSRIRMAMEWKAEELRRARRRAASSPRTTEK
jgi:STE24 endopeptidase